jgi:hypothetical protein
MPKWLYPLAFAFVLFLIYSDASGAGETAGNFAGFIVDMLSAVGQFLTGLFEGAGEAGASSGSGTTATTVVDSFGQPDSMTPHTHLGDPTPHTHPTPTE